MDYADWRTRFERVVAEGNESLDIAEGALIIAADEYPELDVEKYLTASGRWLNTSVIIFQGTATLEKRWGC